MNETIFPDSKSDVPRPASDSRVQVPDTSLVPGGEKALSPAEGMLKHAAKGAHDTIDRLADSAAPAVRKLGDSVTAAESALHATTARLRVTRDEWTEGVRTTVRGNPLASVAAALALGVLVARLTR